MCTDLDRQPPDQSAYYSFEANQGGYEISLTNILIAGRPIVDEILAKWEKVYKKGMYVYN